jgi:hypothetical protein
VTIIDSWPAWVAIAVTGGWGLLAVAGIAHSLYLSRRHLDAIKEALKNSRYIYLWGDSLGRRGLIWSLLEIAKIAGMIAWPRASILLGKLDPVDLKNFPPHLKRYLVANLTIMTTASTWMVVATILANLR